MGLPEVNIAFEEKTRKQLADVGVGKILIIIKDATVSGIKEYLNFEDVKENYTSENKKLIETCFIGNVQYSYKANDRSLELQRYKPEKVIVCSFLESSTLEATLKTLETVNFDYLVMPSAEQDDNTKLIRFIADCKERNLEAFAILSTSKSSNNPDIIEVEIPQDMDEAYSGNKLLPYVASICAGTPLEQSITYAELHEINNITSKSKSDIESLINKGKITFIKKGGKVRIASGVTSLTSINEKRGESHKVLKLVRLYKYIYNRISTVIINHYIGKVPNSYANKVVLIAEIKRFLKRLNDLQLIEEDYYVDLDENKTIEYLKSKGVNTSDLDINKIKQQNTGNKVFIKMKIKAIDSMENFDINVEV